MAIDFPNSPTNGQTYTVGDKTWVYNSAETKWNSVTSAPVGPTGPTGPTGAASNVTGPAGQSLVSFNIPGTLAVFTGTSRFYFYSAATITKVVVSAGTSPTGSDIIFDINKNGTTMYTTQGNRPKVTVGSFYSVATNPDVTSISANDYITIDVDQIGSGTVGSDAIVTIYWT